MASRCSEPDAHQEAARLDKFNSYLNIYSGRYYYGRLRIIVQAHACIHDDVGRKESGQDIQSSQRVRRLNVFAQYLYICWTYPCPWPSAYCFRRCLSLYSSYMSRPFVSINRSTYMPVRAAIISLALAWVGGWPALAT